MRDPGFFWFLLAVASAGTFGLRLSFLVLVGKIEEPKWFRPALKYVPAAVMSALVSSSLLIRDDQLSLGLDNHRLLAGIAAGVVGYLTRSLLWTIVSGLGALALLTWWLGH